MGAQDPAGGTRADARCRGHGLRVYQPLVGQAARVSEEMAGDSGEAIGRNAEAERVGTDEISARFSLEKMGYAQLFLGFSEKEPLKNGLLPKKSGHMPVFSEKSGQRKRGENGLFWPIFPDLSPVFMGLRCFCPKTHFFYSL